MREFSRDIKQVYALRIVFFGVWTWDFMSDLIFVGRAFDQGFALQAWMGLIFFVVPWSINVVLLIKSENIWVCDSAIKYQMARWLLKYNKKLILLTLICGSAFAAVDLCNSRAFGMCDSLFIIYFELQHLKIIASVLSVYCVAYSVLIMKGQGIFNMGLTERHLKKFHGQRIFSTVLFENLPQLCIQIWYFIARGDTDLVVLLTFISSVVSIFFALIDVYSSLTLTSAMKLAMNNNTLQIEAYFFDLVGTTVIENRSSFKHRPNAMRKILARLLEVDLRSVECNYVLKTENGLQYGFTVMSINSSKTKTGKKSSHRIDRIVNIYSNSNDQNDTFLQEIIETWKLDELADDINDLDINVTDIVTLYDFQIGDNKTIFNHDCHALIQSDFYKENKNRFIFERIGLFQTIFISNNVNIIDDAKENTNINANINKNKNENDTSTTTMPTEILHTKTDTGMSVDIVTTNQLNLAVVETHGGIGYESGEEKNDDGVDTVEIEIEIEQVTTHDHEKRTGQVAMLQTVHEQITEEMKGTNALHIDLHNIGFHLGGLIPSMHASRSHVVPTLSNRTSVDTVTDAFELQNVMPRGLKSRSLSRSVSTPIL